MKRLIWLVLAMCLVACGGAQSAAGRLATGIGVPSQVHAVVFDFTYDSARKQYGECKRVSPDEYWIVIYVGQMRAEKRPVADAWIAEAIEHELAHALRTCTDVDHAEIGGAVRVAPVD